MKVILREKRDKITELRVEDFKRIISWLSSSLEPNLEVLLCGFDITNGKNFDQILEIIEETRNIFSINFAIEIPVEEFNKKLVPYFDKIFLEVEDNLEATKLNRAYDALDDTLIFYGSKLFNPERGDVSKIIFSSTIRDENQDFTHFWKIVRTYGANEVRLRVGLPKEKDKLFNREEYYSKIKKPYINFINEATKNNLYVILDQMQIPVCYFSPQELSMIINRSGLWYSEFGALKDDVTIDCDLNIRAILNLEKDKDVVHLNDFTRIERLVGWVEMEIEKYKKNNYLPKCKDCILKDRFCNCGCYGFKENDYVKQY